MARSNRKRSVNYGHPGGIKKIAAPGETNQFFSEISIPYSIYNGIAHAIRVT